MNLRCIYCQTPFTLPRAEMLGAIVTMNERHQNHYDAHCPRCRRANSISRQRMELFFPNWQDAAKQLASETSAAAHQKTEPLPKAMKEMVEKKVVSKKPAEKAAIKKPAAAKAPAETKSVAKKAAEPKPKKK